MAKMGWSFKTRYKEKQNKTQNMQHAYSKTEDTISMKIMPKGHLWIHRNIITQACTHIKEDTTVNEQYKGVSKSFWTESIMIYMLITINTR
jgi:hypothetical protein